MFFNLSGIIEFKDIFSDVIFCSGVRAPLHIFYFLLSIHMCMDKQNKYVTHLYIKVFTFKLHLHISIHLHAKYLESSQWMERNHSGYVMLSILCLNTTPSWGKQFASLSRGHWMVLLRDTSPGLVHRALHI